LTYTGTFMFKSSIEGRSAILQTSLFILHHFEPAVPRYLVNVMARGTRTELRSEDTERGDHWEDAGVCEMMCAPSLTVVAVHVINETA